MAETAADVLVEKIIGWGVDVVLGLRDTEEKRKKSMEFQIADLRFQISDLKSRSLYASVSR